MAELTIASDLLGVLTSNYAYKWATRGGLQVMTESWSTQTRQNLEGNFGTLSNDWQLNYASGSATM